MYGSVFSAHVGHYYYGESALLHLWLHPWMLPWMRLWNVHYWVTGSPLPEAPKCSDHDFSLVFLLSPFWDLCSSFQQKMLEENLRVTKKSPCYLILPLPCSHWIHSRHHVLASSNEAGSLWTGWVLLCHIPGIACFWVPKIWHLW